MYKDDRKLYEEEGGAKMADDLMFSAEELRIDEGLGYPKAYAKLCRDRGFGPYSHGPPFTFTPYALQSHQALRANELDQLFPIIDPKAKPSAKPKIFMNLLWKQLNHLGNAGFDPESFRVDSYGNVLYFHADSASPLAWDIDHWFPCSRGGLTVSSNLRLLQWQVCKKKYHKLEFLVPWWDLQVGISVNQFLSIFASSNSDFRQRGFYLLFSNGESEELNSTQTVDSHCFPQPFQESYKKSGLAPAAIVVSRKESNFMTPTRKSGLNMSKENENQETVMNPYQAIVIARDSLRQNEETIKKQTEIEKLDEEVTELKQKNEEERTSIQDLELMLIKKRRRAEKCRRLAEAQSSYKSMLEKMIRDAMHQSVVYKEQVRLNQAASNSLMARLEAQKAICDSSERELHKKFKHRDELEKQIRPELEQMRKRSRMGDVDDYNDDKMVLYQQPETKEDQDSHKDAALCQENDDMDNTVLYLPGVNSEHKPLRVFLEEEHKDSEAELERKEDDIDNGKKMERLRIKDNGVVSYDDIEEMVNEDDFDEEDEEKRKERGKGNVEKWLQILLKEEEGGNTHDNNNNNTSNGGNKTDEIIRKMNLKYPEKETLKNEETEIVEKEEGKGVLNLRNPPYKKSGSCGGEMECEKLVSRRKSFEVKERSEKIGKFKDIARSESARVLRRIPSSPSIILGMKKGVDCMRRKPAVMGDDEDVENRAVNGNFIRSSYKVIKKVVKM